jgi:hypothetical protein
MKMKKLFLIILIFVSNREDLIAQNVLDVAHVVNRYIINGDTIVPCFSGTVIDSTTSRPIKGAIVMFTSSRGDYLKINTDENGQFKFNQMPSGCNIKILYLPQDAVKPKEIEFSSKGMPDPIRMQVVLIW